MINIKNVVLDCPYWEEQIQEKYEEENKEHPESKVVLWPHWSSTMKGISQYLARWKAWKAICDW